MPDTVEMMIALGFALVLTVIIRWRINWIVVRINPREILYIATTEERNRVYADGLLGFLKDWHTWVAVIGYSIPLVLLSAGVQELMEHTARVRGWTVTRLALGLYLGLGIAFLVAPLMYALYRRWMRAFLREYLNEHGIPICRKCGYDLRGLTEPRCPECSTEFLPPVLPPNPD